jgi:adenylate cyclase class IV
MARNVEIKARANDFTRQRQLAGEIADEGPAILRQRDVFFQVPEGRLKLRLFPPEHSEPDQLMPGELIAYSRPDQTGPKTSDYTIAATPDGLALLATLSRALPVLGEVNKTRELFLIGQTRIHFDQVTGLGRFIELEVVLQERQTTAFGRRQADHLMRQLGINGKDLIAQAYLDLILHSSP